MIFFETTNQFGNIWKQEHNCKLVNEIKIVYNNK